MNEACIWQYIFLGEVGGKPCWHNIRRGGYLMMMLDYKGGRGGWESGEKWLHNKWMHQTMSFVNFHQTNLYFFYIIFFDYMWCLCWVLIKLQVH